MLSGRIIPSQCLFRAETKVAVRMYGIICSIEANVHRVLLLVTPTASAYLLCNLSGCASHIKNTIRPIRRVGLLRVVEEGA